MVQPERRPPGDDEPEFDAEPGHTMVYRPRQQPTEAASAVDLGIEREAAVLTWDDERVEVERQRMVVGRSKECDVQLTDPNVSRRHAEVRQEGTAYWIVDLGSTNGIEVNGRRVKRAKLEDGDTLTLGSTEITFRRERS